MWNWFAHKSTNIVASKFWTSLIDPSNLHPYCTMCCTTIYVFYLHFAQRHIPSVLPWTKLLNEPHLTKNFDLSSFPDVFVLWCPKDEGKANNGVEYFLSPIWIFYKLTSSTIWLKQNVLDKSILPLKNIV